MNKFFLKSKHLAFIGMLFFTFLFSVLIPSQSLFAQGEYIPLAPLPYTTTAEGGGAGTTDFGTYLTGAFRLAIALAGLLAVVRIVWGGIKYMSSDAINNKSEGKEVISGAVYGLLLAIASWLIVSTINSSILGQDDTIVFDLNLERGE